MAKEGISLSDQHRRSAKTCPADKLLKEFDAVVLCCGATKPPRSAHRRPRRSRASISRWSSSPPTPRSLLDGHKNGNYISTPPARTSSSSAAAIPAPTASARPAPRLQEPGPTRDLAEAADGARRGQPLARMAQSLPDGLRTGRGRRPCSARTRAPISRPTKRFEGDDHGQCESHAHGARSSGNATSKGVSFRKKCPARIRSSPPSSCCSPWVFSGPNNNFWNNSTVERDPRSNVKAEHGKLYHQPSPASLPPVTRGAGRALSSGPSTKAAAPRARWTAF